MDEIASPRFREAELPHAQPQLTEAELLKALGGSSEDNPVSQTNSNEEDNALAHDAEDNALALDAEGDASLTLSERMIKALASPSPSLMEHAHQIVDEAAEISNRNLPYSMQQLLKMSKEGYSRGKKKAEMNPAPSLATTVPTESSHDHTRNTGSKRDVPINTHVPRTQTGRASVNPSGPRQSESNIPAQVIFATDKQLSECTDELARRRPPRIQLHGITRSQMQHL